MDREELEKTHYTKNTQYDLSEKEFQKEVELARGPTGQTPPVAPYLGEPILAEQIEGPPSRAPRALNRDMRVEECDELRNSLCPQYSDCLNAADRALAKPKRVPYEDAVTFVCDFSCPQRSSSDVSTLGHFTKGFLSFIESDKKAVR